MQQTDLDKVFQPWIAGIPAACGAVLGFLGLHLTKDDPSIKTKQFVGGILLAAFTGGTSCILLEQTGLHPEIAAVVSSSIGASGMKGYEWLLQRSQDSSNKGG